MPTRTEQRLKRAACLIASQLPEDQGEAMRVLHYTQCIIKQLAEEKPPGTVIPLAQQGQRYLAIVREDGREAPNDFQDTANPG